MSLLHSTSLFVTNRRLFINTNFVAQNIVYWKKTSSLKLRPAASPVVVNYENCLEVIMHYLGEIITISRWPSTWWEYNTDYYYGVPLLKHCFLRVRGKGRKLFRQGFGIYQYECIVDGLELTWHESVNRTDTGNCNLFDSPCIVLIILMVSVMFLRTSSSATCQVRRTRRWRIQDKELTPNRTFWSSITSAWDASSRCLACANVYQSPVLSTGSLSARRGRDITNLFPFLKVGHQWLYQQQEMVYLRWSFPQATKVLVHSNFITANLSEEFLDVLDNRLGPIRELSHLTCHFVNHKIHDHLRPIKSIRCLIFISILAILLLFLLPLGLVYIVIIDCFK